MKIVIGPPPVLDDILAHGMHPHQNVVYTYADTLYNPSGTDIPDHVMHHEETHAEQQGHTEKGAEKWWSRYLVDAYFRIDQEAEAYARQYDFVCQTVLDRNQRNKVLIRLSQSLASPVYGHILTPSASFSMIKSKSKTK